MKAQTVGSPLPVGDRMAALMRRLEQMPPSRVAASPDETAAEPAAPGTAAAEVTQLGPYRIVKVLGRGGMGTVYEAEDTHLQRTVALKVMKPELAENPAARERFLREARAAARLQHDHIVTIYQVGEDRGVPFLAMELLQGTALDQWLKKNPRPRLAQVLKIGKEIAAGLAAAHDKGLIHRDVKPGNVWLEASKGGRVKLLDFGLARATSDDVHLTQEGAIVGTPAFMAPEQAQGQPVDARCDLFSLGCVLYRLTTGEMAFKGDTTLAVLSALALEYPRPVREVNPKVPPALAELIMKLLEKDAAKRPASAKAVLEALRAVEREATKGGAATAQPRPAESVEAAAKGSPAPARRRPWRWVGIAAAVLLGLVGGGVLLGQIIIKIFDKDGKQVGQATVPEGGSFKVEPGQPTPPAAASPFDGLRREDIPADELALAGDGDPQQAPDGLVGIFGTGRLRGWKSVTCGAYSADGKRLAAYSLEGRVRVWDTATGRLLLSVAPTILAPAPALSADGMKLAVGQDNTAAVIEVATGKTLQRFAAGTGTLSSMAFSPNGQQFATGSTGKGVRLWNLESGKLIQNLEGHTQHVRSLVFSPDGKFLASGSGNAHEDVPGEVIVWDSATGQSLHVFSEKTSVNHLVFLPDSIRLASASLFTPGIRVRDVKTGKEVAVLQADVAGNGTGALGAGGNHLFSLRPGHAPITEWTLDRLEGKGTALIGTQMCIFGPDGRQAALLEGVSLRLYDLDKRRDVFPREGHGALIKGLSVRADGRRLLTSGYMDGVRVWDTATGKELPNLARPTCPTAVFSPDGKTLAWDGSSGITLTDADSGVNLLQLQDSVMAIKGNLSFRPDGQRLAAAIKTEARVWDAKGNVVTTIPLENRSHTVVAYSPDGKRLATGGDGPVTIRDAETGKELLTLKDTTATAQTLAFSPDGARLATAMKGGIGVWDVQSGERVLTILGSALAYSPDGKWLAVADDAGREMLLDAATGKPERRWTLPGKVSSLAFAPDSRHLLTGNGNGTAYVLRLAEPPATPPPPAVAGWQATPEQQQWLDAVAKMKPEEQVEAVKKKLMEENPGFDGKLSPGITPDGRVNELTFNTAKVTSIWPIRALEKLTALDCGGTDGLKGSLVDLSPLQGLRLKVLNIQKTRVYDLTLLRGMPLERLTCSQTPVADLRWSSPATGWWLRTRRPPHWSSMTASRTSRR